MTDSTQPSTPNVNTAADIGTIIRLVLGILGTFGVTWAQTVSASAIETAAGMFALLISLCWGLWKNRKQAQMQHDSIVTSLQIQQPVEIKPPTVL